MNEKLSELWNEVDNCKECKDSDNKLKHILGGGKETNPEIMFVFINPTYRNITANPNHKGRRFPFIGTREIWDAFIKSGILDSSILKNFSNADFVINEVEKKEIYFTNLVKCTTPNSELPDTKLINKKLSLLFKEIDIVKPNLIVTFGLLPFYAITGSKIKLSEFYNKQLKSNNLITYTSKEIEGAAYNVFPCYFPVGRGKRKEALILLKLIKNKVGII